MNEPRLVVSIAGDLGSESEELDDASRSLRAELAEHPVVDGIDDLKEGAATKGAKGDELTIAAFALAILPVALTELIGFLKHWSGRSGGHPVRVQVQDGGRRIGVEYDPQSMTQADLLALVRSLEDELEPRPPAP